MKQKQIKIGILQKKKPSKIKAFLKRMKKGKGEFYPDGTRVN